MKTLISIALFTLVACGCSSEPAGPTYAEAVATYQAEVALLESLLAKRQEIEDEYSASVESLRKEASFNLEYEGAIRDARGKVSLMTLDQVAEILLREDTDDVALTTEKWVAARRSRTLRQLEELEPLISRQNELVQKAKTTRDRLSLDQ